MSDLREKVYDGVSNYCAHEAIAANADANGDCLRCYEITDDILARIEQLVSERTKALREALDAAGSHIPKYVKESGGGFVEGYMACSCGLKANGVTRWDKLWSEHIRAILKDGQP